MSSKTQKQSNFSNIIFVTALAVITIFLAVFMFIMIGKPFVVKEYSDIKQLTVENYKTYDKKHTEYYVYLYNTKSSTIIPKKKQKKKIANYKYNGFSFDYY